MNLNLLVTTCKQYLDWYRVVGLMLYYMLIHQLNIVI